MLDAWENVLAKDGESMVQPFTIASRPEETHHPLPRRPIQTATETELMSIATVQQMNFPFLPLLPAGLERVKQLACLSAKMVLRLTPVKQEIQA